MSLLSQQDKLNVIDALRYYLQKNRHDLTMEKYYEYNSLLKWIELDYKKNEN